MEMPKELKIEKILAAIRTGERRIGVIKTGARNIFAEHMEGTLGFSSDAAAIDDPSPVDYTASFKI